MKQVIWSDEKGYKHISLLRDQDPDTMAPQGILCDPPDVNELDWETIKKELHNLLVDRGFTNYKSLNKPGLNNTILVPVRNRLIALFRMKEETV